MIECGKCKGRMFVDGAYTTDTHIEIFCIRCGARKFYHGADVHQGEGLQIWLAEKMKAKASICQ